MPTAKVCSTTSAAAKLLRLPREPERRDSTYDEAAHNYFIMVCVHASVVGALMDGRSSQLFASPMTKGLELSLMCVEPRVGISNRLSEVGDTEEPADAQG